MPRPLTFQITARSRSCAARVGVAHTPHGPFETPAFMPVGTRGSVKGLTPDQVAATGAAIVLANAYHLMLRPGAPTIAALGGLHRFMGWSGPILTDSGGYQAFSMADINSIDDDGVTFASIVDGSSIRLSPEQSIEVQNQLGADIIMAFDDCPPSRTGETSEEDYRARLVTGSDRTTRWLHRCVAAHARPDEQALMGIVQGGTDEALRRASVDAVCSIDLPGYAIGGVAVGETPQMISRVVRFTAPLLPADKPRYLMGVGYERDIVMAVRAGVDLFDCVLPTRNGRNGLAFTRAGRMHLRNARFHADQRPIDPECHCSACRGGFSRAYLRHLFLAGEMLGPILVSLHNLHHFQRLLLDIRQAIREDTWLGFERSWPVLGSEDPIGAAAEESGTSGSSGHSSGSSSGSSSGG